ncbi:MAG: hypothetical protein K2F87_00265, partial [Muribaculaceae bacterium]|nr:hypothetical protein [Muribaculaceae bacterium]
ENARKDCRKGEGKKCDAKCAGIECNQENCTKADCPNAAQCGKADRKGCKGDSVRGPRFDKKGRSDGFRGKHAPRMGEGNRDQMRARLFNGIELSEEQKAQIEALDKRMAEERKALRDEEKVDRTEAKAEMKKAKESARQAYDQALQEILTKEQYVKYESNREAMKMRMGARKEMGKVKADVSRVKAAEKAAVKAAKKADKASN